MRSRFRVGPHPVHPMLIVVPSTLFPLLVVLDLLHLWTGDAALWSVGFWIAAVGVVSTLAAMVPGIVDLAGVPDESRAHRTALIHTIVGTATLVAYAVAAWVRFGAGTDRFALALGLDVVGSLLIVAQGWLGGELVYRHHLGVLTREEGAEPTPFKSKATRASPPPTAPRKGASRP